MIRICQIPLCFSTITATTAKIRHHPGIILPWLGPSIHQVNWVEKFAQGVIDEHKLDVSQLFTGFALNARQYL